MKKSKNISSSGLIWVWVALLIIGLDRISKIFAVKYLIFAEPLRVLPFFNLTLVFNKGAAFGFLNQAPGWQNLLLGGIAMIVSIGILIWLAKSSARAVWVNIALNLILGGAMGNSWDRALYGYVIDYFEFHLGTWHFAIFNLADSAISVGAFMMIVYWIWVERKKA